MNILIIIGGLIVVGLGLAGWYFFTKKSHNAGPKNSGALVQNLEIEKARSGVILNAIADGVVLIDNQKIIQIFNPAAGRLTGWNPQEATGLVYDTVIKLVDEKDKPYAAGQDPFIQALQDGQSKRDNTALIVSRNNKHSAVDISVSPLLDKQNQVNGVVGIMSDVGEARSEERQRAEFISTASHEMRTPVAAIEGYLSLAMNDKVSKVDAKARDYLEKAHSSTQHLGQLFQDLLTSAKAEDGRLSSHPAVVEMGAFLERLTEDFKFIAQQKGLLLEYIIGTSSQAVTDARDSNSRVIRPLYYVHVDPDRIQEVISNLFDNAVKYTEAGKVTIGLTGDQQVVQFYIKDTGAGIAAEDISHLFQKFYRVNSTLTRTVGGTGLGLFICRKIVELYNGRIWVESQPTKGSTFFINLPRLDNLKAQQIQAAEAGTSTNLVIPTNKN